jgi:hypothetical protein
MQLTNLEGEQFCRTVNYSVLILTLFNREFDRCADLFINLDIYKLRDKDDIYAILSQVASGECQGFNGLVYCAGTYRLHLSQVVFAKYSSDRPGNSGCSGGAFNLDYIHFALLVLMATMSEPLF